MIPIGGATDYVSGAFFILNCINLKTVEKGVDTELFLTYKYYSVILHCNIKGTVENMPYDYKQTHENILSSARTQFKEKGFRDASVRNICQSAGVTNGAFYAHFKSKEDLFGSIVEPCIEGLKELYCEEKDLCLDIKSSEDIIRAFRQSYSSADSFVNYLCKHREDFLILLDCSAGSEYENFQEDLIKTEAASMTSFLNISKKYVKNPGNITENIVRLGASFLIMTLFNGLRKGMNSEEILKETAMVSDYCIAGYRELLGI